MGEQRGINSSKKATYKRPRVSTSERERGRKKV